MISLSQVWRSDDDHVWLPANLLPRPLICHLRCHIPPLQVVKYLFWKLQQFLQDIRSSWQQSGNDQNSCRPGRAPPSPSCLHFPHQPLLFWPLNWSLFLFWPLPWSVFSYRRHDKTYRHTVLTTENLVGKYTIYMKIGRIFHFMKVFFWFRNGMIQSTRTP